MIFSRSFPASKVFRFRISGICGSFTRSITTAKNSNRWLEKSREKNRTIVEYALQPSIPPIGVATYRTVRELPRELKGELPGTKEIARLLEDGE